MSVLRAIRSFWVVLALILIWQIWVGISGINSIVMPSPLGVFRAVIADPVLYLASTAQTVLLAAIGLALGLFLGTALAILTWFSPLLSGLLTPLGLIFSSVPVVALIPILARLFGYDERTVLAIVALICFFPSFVFTAAGLRALPPGSADLFRVLGASTGTRLRLLALPAALPEWTVALRIAAANAILAAMVAEFLMGTSGLGYLFAAARSDFDMERALGASAIATIVSIASFLLAARAEAWVRRNWQ